MDIAQIITISSCIVALVIAGIAYHRSGQPVTMQGVQEFARDTTALAAELNEVAQMAVAASQELKETGKIDSGEAAFQNAVAHVNAWYNAVAPNIYLDPKVVANAVNGAYWWLKKSQPPVPKPSNDLDILEQLRREQGAGFDQQIPR